MKQYEIGEALARQCLTANGFDVIDRRADPEYWRRDIDFTAVKDGVRQNIEVKWDSRISESGAIFFELLTDIQQHKQGWASYTDADFIFYGDAVRQLFYVFSVADMRRYLTEHPGDYETRIANDYDERTGRVKKQSLGAIVPLARMQSAIRVQVIDIKQRLLIDNESSRVYNEPEKVEKTY